jgi:hypothetical protein
MKIQKNLNARQIARENGERYYFTGLPCKHGHVAKRATVSGACVECTDAASAAWKKKNPERQAEAVNRYKKANAELIKARDRKAAAERRAKDPISAREIRNRAYAKKVAMEGREVRAFNRLTEQEVMERLESVHGDKLQYVCGFSSMTTNAVFRCAEHAVEVEAHPHNVLRGANPCPKCNHMKSGKEEEIASFLEQYTWVERRNRAVIAPKEIDIWLPEFNIGIEFHGLYWHTTNRVGKTHREKWELAQRAGVRLVQIFEDEWLNKQDIVKARLLAFIGRSEKRDARKLTLKNVVWREAKVFLNATHIQGAGPAGTAYGLYEDDVLVAVASFGKSRSGAMTGARKEGEFEVLRYASTGSVRGGFTRLFSAFLRDANPETVISYCDLRYGTGGLYEQARFALHSVTEPDYWWVPAGKIERVSRYAVQKHKIADMAHPLNVFYAVGKTENQICTEAGWEKIHGVGNQKWVWRNEKSDH